MKHLNVSADTTGMDTLDRELVPHPSMEVVYLGRSETDEHEEEIAEVIHQLWPYLQEDSMLEEEALSEMDKEEVFRWFRIRNHVERLRPWEDGSEESGSAVD
ncbi:hypothetical protein FRB90_011799 [Tulasnella sp. 427]|nr:hypothetical protein FRB90_011799 [Tulasnella sp. 427]